MLTDKQLEMRKYETTGPTFVSEEVKQRFDLGRSDPTSSGKWRENTRKRDTSSSTQIKRDEQGHSDNENNTDRKMWKRMTHSAQRQQQGRDLKA